MERNTTRLPIIRHRLPSQQITPIINRVRVAPKIPRKKITYRSATQQQRSRLPTQREIKTEFLLNLWGFK